MTSTAWARSAGMGPEPSGSRRDPGWRRIRRSGLLSVALIGFLVLAGHLSVQAGITPDHKGVTLDLDWDTCDNSQWTTSGNGALEAGSDPERQSVITSQVRRVAQGCANRFEIED